MLVLLISTLSEILSVYGIFLSILMHLACHFY